MPEPRFRSPVRHLPSIPRWQRPTDYVSGGADAGTLRAAIAPKQADLGGRFPGPVTYLAAGTASLIGSTGAILDPVLPTALRASLGIALGAGAGFSYYLALRTPAPGTETGAATVTVAPIRELPKPTPRPRATRTALSVTARPQRIARMPVLTAPRSSFARAGAIAAPAPAPVPQPIPRATPPSPPVRQPDWARAIPPLPPAPTFTLVSHDEIWQDSLPDMAYWGGASAPAAAVAAPIPARVMPAPVAVASRVEPIPRSVARPVAQKTAPIDPGTPITFSSSGGFIQRVGAATPPSIADAPCAECGRGSGNPIATARCPRCARPLCKGCSSRFERAPAEVPCYHQLGSLS